MILVLAVLCLTAWGESGDRKLLLSALFNQFKILTY